MEAPAARRLRRAAAAGLAALACAAPCGRAAAQLQPPTLPSLDALPRPQTPPPEHGRVVPARVERWRQEAKAAEHGEGVERDPIRAAELYCRASRYGDAESQYSLAWMLTNSRGILRDEAQAAHLFAAAAEQGHVQAQNMAARLGTPLGNPPDCLRQPDEDAAPPPAATAAAPQRPGARGTPPRQPPWAAPWQPPPPPPNAPEPIVRYVRLVAPEYKLQPHLVLAFIATESNFDAYAVSPKNAQGLMQLLPDTAARFGVRNLKDPAQNLRAGMSYLRWLMAYFEGDVRLVAAAYNAGEKAVERYLGVPPYAETRLYVAKIRAASGGQLIHPFDPAVTPPSQRLALIRQGPRPRAAGAAPLPR